MRKIFIVLFAALFCLPVGAANPVKDSKTTYAKDALQPFVDSGQLPGAISVLYKDGIQEVCCAGYSDVAAKRPITLDDVFMQCSQTKGFCGVTVAKLVEEGKLSLDDPVSKYLPEFETLWVLDQEKDGVRTLHKAKNVLTLRNCLSHTGGFPFELCAKDYTLPRGGWSGEINLRKTAVIAANCPIAFEPGTKYSYSNTGIDIAAAVVEVVTGMKWEDYLQMTVLDPLEMTSSSFWPTDEQLSRKVEMYQLYSDGRPFEWMKDGAPWMQPPYNDSHVVSSAGAGLWTTANDQLKFYKMLMNLGVGENGQRVLKEETVRRMLATSQINKELAGYSLGFSAPNDDSDDAWFGHGGAWGTNCSVNWHKKELKLWVVQLIGDGPRPWDAPWNEAVEKFFKNTVDKSGDAYVGRLK